MALTILDPPAAFKAADWSLSLADTVAEPRSGYTMVESRLDYAGEMWALTVTTPPLRQPDAVAILAWCDRLRDADAAARLSVPLPIGGLGMFGTSAAATVTVTADAVAGARSVAVTGIGVGLTLGAGQMIAVGDHLHRLRATVTGTAATLSLTPRLRRPVTIGQTLSLVDATGIFRLQARPTHHLTASQFGAHAAPMTLEFREALA